MTKSAIRFATFPRTEPPPAFASQLVDVFRAHEATISSISLPKGLQSNGVLGSVADDLSELGFEVERGKRKEQKIERPVFYGENGVPTLNYQIDAYHAGWKCGLEIEAGRGWMGNAVYRDIMQASLMIGIECLCLAVANAYKFKYSNKDRSSSDYANTRHLAEAIYGHSRVKLPYRLLLVGY